MQAEFIQARPKNKYINLWESDESAFKRAEFVKQ